MKRYLREIEVSGLILTAIGIVCALIWGTGFGAWACGFGLLLLLAADVLLFGALYERGAERLLRALCALCLAATLCMVYIGVRDILRTDYLLDFNRELIEDCVRNGETDISIPRPYANTRFSALSGLPYLNLEDPGDWPNASMAKYYGAATIRGY